MTAERPPITLQQALSALSREHQRVLTLQNKLVSMGEELEVLRGAAFHASTSRLMAEEELDDTRDRLQLALDAAQLALWEWTISTGDVYLDARWAELMGDFAMDSHCQLSELLGRIHPDDVAAFKKGLDDATQGVSARFSVQYRIRNVDDQWVWLESHGMVADRNAAGKAQRLIGVAADIQERKRLQADTEAARQQAEVANRAKTEFLANVSHEVRTPLNGVMGLIRLLMDSPLGQEQQHWLKLMDDSAQTLLGLLNDILDLSKIEAGKMSLESTVFDVATLVEQACAPLVAQSQLKPLTVDLRVHPQLSGPVVGDPGRLRQVLTNLLSNAVKFTPAGGHIRVEARPSSRQGVVFEVSDTGIGIAKEQQQSIFDAFTQADASTTRKYGGTGLGLAISSKLVEMMGGRIRLTSRLGEGSVFSFDLPLAAPDSQAGQAPKSAPMELAHLHTQQQTFHGLRVLVAEDHPINELLMVQLLQKLGCHTTVARNGLEAVAAWKRGDIDLIMMDVQMPELNGLDATAEIRALEKTQAGRSSANRVPHIPIVAVTANAMSGDREKCMSAGMDTYTSKPVSPQALTTSMAQALDISARWAPEPSRMDLLPEPPALASSPPIPAPARPPQPAPALNIETLRHRLKGNEQALNQLGKAVCQDITQHVQAMVEASRQRDATATALRAHALKGALASLTAQRAAALANGLELAARSGEWALFGRALPVLQNEIQKIEQTLGQVAAHTDSAGQPLGSGK